MEVDDAILFHVTHYIQHYTSVVHCAPHTAYITNSFHFSTISQLYNNLPLVLFNGLKCYHKYWGHHSMTFECVFFLLLLQTIRLNHFFFFIQHVFISFNDDEKKFIVPFFVCSSRCRQSTIVPDSPAAFAWMVIENTILSHKNDAIISAFFHFVAKII